MAIQVRRGNYADFDPDKMLPGEWATATSGDPNADDGIAVYMCFKAGKVKRMATYDDMKQNIEDATSDVADDVAEQLEENINEAIQLAQSASSAANSAAEKANSASQLAQSASSAANSAASAAQAAAQEAQNAADNVKNDFYGARSSFPVTGETKKLYVDNTVNPALAYIWNGSDYIPVGGGVEFTGSGSTILMQSQQVPKSFRSLKVYGKSTQNGTPSPENPVPIETAGSDGTVDVNLTGANLFDASKMPTKSQGGATVTNNGDGSFTVSGSGNMTSDFNSAFYNLSVEEKKKMFKAGVQIQGLRTLQSPIVTTPYFRLVIIKNGVYNREIYNNDSLTEEEFNSDDITLQYRFFANTGNPITSGTVKPMVYQYGDGTWEPFHEPQSLSISTPNGLPGIPVSSGGNYTDADGQQWVCDEIDLARGKYVQRVGTHLIRAVNDISNERQQNPDYFGCVSPLLPDGIGYNKKLMSDKLVFVGIDKNIDGSEITIVPSNGYMVFGLKKSVVSEETVRAVTNYLSENPITILYASKEPIETDLSAEEMEAYKALKTYTPTTVISSDSGVWMEADLVDSDILYPHAENTSYDNSTSGLTADNVQEAIDENAAAIGALNSSPDVINIILISGANYSGYGNCYYYKKGSRVHIHIGIQGLTEDTSTTIAVLPAGYRPSSVILAIGFGSSWTEKATLLVTQNGELNIQSEGTYAMADVEYDAFS